MGALEIRLFGNVEVRWGAESPRTFATWKARSLFAYLVLNRKRQFSREQLQERFWGDLDAAAARKALRSSLWRVRLAVDRLERADGESLVHAAGPMVWLELPADAWVDVEDFEGRCRGLKTAMAATRSGEARTEAEAAVALYRGPLADELYDDWCVLERERMRLLLLQSLEFLMEHDRAREGWAEAIGWGRRILDLDPLREHVHRELMRCHYQMGDRPLCVRQYQICAALLREELGIEPMAETRRLIERIAVEAPGLSPPRGGTGDPGPRTGGPRPPVRAQERPTTTA